MTVITVMAEKNKHILVANKIANVCVIQKDTKDKAEAIRENERCSCKFVLCQKQAKVREIFKFGDNDR